MLNEHRYLRKIAHLYYVEDLNLRQIADKLNTSIAGVSRALSRAKESGVVRISIDSDPDSYHELEAEMERRFGLNECRVTASAERPEAQYREFAQVLSELLPRLLPRGGLLGTSWGETLKAMSEHLMGTESVRADVVPIIGAMGTIETGIFPNSIARSFADRLGGKAYLVNTPAVLDTAETAARLMADSTFGAVRELWNRLDAVILGASALDESTSVFRGGIFNRDDLEAMRAAGGVAAANFLVMDDDGRIVQHPPADRIVCIPPDTLRRVRRVIVAAGGPHKAEALSAVLRSELVHVCITDVQTATRCCRPE